MDHLPYPEACRAFVAEIEYTGVAPKYDHNGFSGFMERAGISKYQFLIDIVVDQTNGQTSKSDERKSEYLNSLLQEWCWFGLLHELEIRCEVPMDVSALVGKGQQLPRVLNTSFLPAYVRSSFVSILSKFDIPLDLEIGETVYISTAKDLTKPFRILGKLEDTRYQAQNVKTGAVMDIVASSLKRDEPAQSSRSQDVDFADLERRYEKFSLAGMSSMITDLTYQKLRNWDAMQALYGQKSTSRLSRCVNEACDLTCQIRRMGTTIISEDLVDAIQVLCESIEVAAQNMFVEFFRLNGLSRSFGASYQWCPTRTRLFSGHGVSLSEVLKMLPSYDSRDHSACFLDLCQHRPSTTSEVMVLHTEDCNPHDCVKIVFDEQELMSVLDAGGSPCLLPCDLDAADTKVVVADAENVPYVAISHVWSHGLGNPVENALPRCQFRKLFELIKRCTDGTTALWIDTISVPIAPSHKRKALAGLRRVYKNAKAVLVVDHHLQQVGNDPVERIFQIMGSEWMQRLWTLQEGRLAQSLLFKFKDEIVPLAEILRFNYGQDDRTFFVDIKGEIALSLARLFREIEDVGVRFDDLIYDLAGRGVTDRADEPICLASLLALNLEGFGTDKLTMASVYRAVPNDLPARLLFTPGPRLQAQPGLGWAPTTLLHYMGARKAQTHQTGQLTNDGLTVTLPWIDIEGEFDFKNGPEKRWVYVVNNGESDKHDPEAFAFSVYPPFDRHRGPHTIRRAAVLLEPPGMALTYVFGVLVSLVVDEADTTVTAAAHAVQLCDFISPVMIGHHSSIPVPDFIEMRKDFVPNVSFVRGKFREAEDVLMGRKFCVR